MRPMSEEQEKAINERGRFVLRACPGSGKTFIVAQRLARRLIDWEHFHVGIATLSFTNVAHEQISLELQKLGFSPIPPYPHFLGTIDHFVNTWIFLPFGHLVMGCSQRPSLVGQLGNPWNPSNPRWAWGKSKSEPYDECYRGCRLEDFSYGLDRCLTKVNGERANCPYQKRRCAELKLAFSRAGYATQTDANYWAMRILEEHPNIARALVRRFPEVVIDEAQDTSDVQMRIVDLLVQHGLAEAILVGDPDQAIYEWREAKPEVFTSKMTAGAWKCLTLEENRRSSQLVCQATYPFSTLPHPAKAVGADADCAARPVVIAYSPNDLHPLLNYFISHCHEHGVQPRPENAAILARGQLLVLRLIGLPEEVDPWNHLLTKLMAESAFLLSQREVKLAMRCLENAVGKIVLGDQAQSRGLLQKRVSTEIGDSIWKAALWRLLQALPSPDLCSADWIDKAQSALSGWLAETRLPIADSDSCSLRIKRTVKVGNAQSKEHWTAPVSSFFVGPSVRGDQMTIETIHAAKGKTYEAVMLVLTSRGRCTVKQLAENPTSHEEVRTAYVAMTRPRRILVVAVPDRTDPKYLARFSEWRFEPSLSGVHKA